MSCIFSFESSRYVEVVSNLQLLSMVKNEKIWNFRVSILDSTHQQILQFQQSANQNQENLNYIIQLEEGDNQYLIYDSHLKLDQQSSGIGLCIIKSSTGLMQILDSCTAIDMKPKKELRGQGIEFENSDFLVKIGQFKKNSKQTILLIYLFYKPFSYFDIQREIYKEIYQGFMKKLIDLSNFEEGLNYQDQMIQIINQLKIFQKDREEKNNEVLKDQTRKENEERKNLSNNNINYLGELFMVHHVVGLFNI